MSLEFMLIKGVAVWSLQVKGILIRMEFLFRGFLEYLMDTCKVCKVQPVKSR